MACALKGMPPQKNSGWWANRGPTPATRLFERWAAEGQLTEQKRWQRALAAESRNYGLLSHLIKSLLTLGNQGKSLLEVAQKPELLKQTSRFTQTDPASADIVGLGLRRLARPGPGKARSNCSTAMPSA